MNEEEEIPPPTDIAAEIHRNFLRKSRPGGEYDRILNGNEPIPKALPKSDAEIALIKRQIEIQLDEHEASLADAVNWYREWKARQPKGFRKAKGI